MEQKTRTRANFMDFLMDKGLLLQEQVEDLVTKVGVVPEFKIRELLLQKYLISEEETYSVWAEYLDLPYIDLSLTIFDPEALAMIPSDFARENNLIPFSFYPGELSVAFDNPNINTVDWLKKQTGCEILIHIATKFRILEAIKLYYGEMDIKRVAEELDLSSYSKEKLSAREITEIGPIVNISNGLIADAIKHSASDIHIEPREDYLQVRYRVDGILREQYGLKHDMALPLASRYKVMADLNITEKRRPQDGRIRHVVGEKQIDIRVSVVPTTHGEKIVLRILDKSGMQLNIDRLLFSKHIHRQAMQLISSPHGIFFITGPTGSGKTTTLYSMLNHINSMEKNITTIEDPVEYQLPLTNQIQVNHNIDFGFADALRSVLRQDPDVIMVGEIRDLETARVATEAALTGHLVFSTLHTNNAIDAVLRLVEIGVESFMVAPSIIGILAQRLVRRICQKCKVEYGASAEEMRYFGLPSDDSAIKLFKGNGCPACMGTGYSGRIAIHELVYITDEIRELILQSTSNDRIARAAYKLGYKSMRFDGLKKALRGLTTLSEILRVTTAQEDFLVK